MLVLLGNANAALAHTTEQARPFVQSSAFPPSTRDDATAGTRMALPTTERLASVALYMESAPRSRNRCHDADFSLPKSAVFGGTHVVSVSLVAGYHSLS